VVLYCYFFNYYTNVTGIGYFTLPYLVHSRAKRVYACEWNPHAADALRRNLVLNKVDQRCIVLEGDNAEVSFVF
jgi:tRNA G37 N-methylase Trm5